jgi:hypothetical protein
MPETERAGPDPLVTAYVIGQTPRPDLTADLERRFPSAKVRVVGALDGVRPEELMPCSPDGYPLETRLRDGRRVVIDEGSLAPLLQRAIDAHDDDATVHLVLCAGPFPGLEAPAGPSGARTPLIRPFDAAIAELAARGFHRLDVLVPFAAQVAPATTKWTDAGFVCRVFALADRPSELPLPAWVADLVGDADADALVFDYVGFPADLLGAVATPLKIPVFDPGHLALDVLEHTLGASMSSPP